MPSTTFATIDPSVCVNAKLRRVHRLLNQHYQQMIKPYGLAGSMLSILFLIGKTELNQRQIAHQLVLDESTLSRDITRLITKGWVSKRKGKDARNGVLTITQNGENMLNEIAPKWQALHSNFEHLLGSEFIASMDATIKKLENIIP